MSELYKWAWCKNDTMHERREVRTYAEAKRQIEAQREADLKQLRQDQAPHS